MIEAAAGDLVTTRSDFANQLRHLFGDPAQHKERGLGLKLIQQFERGPRAPFQPTLEAVPEVAVDQLLERSDLEGETWKLAKCNVCDLIFLNPRPSAQSLGQHYPGDYYAYSAAPVRASTTVKQRVRQFLRRHRGLFTALQHTPLAGRLQDPVTQVVGWTPPGRVLDVGCGSGEALNELADLGWETWGVELDPKATARAVQCGHRMWTGSLEDCDVPDASVDVVRMVHVLEHVPSPTETLTAVRRVLRPGGRLIIELPNIAHVLSAALRDHSWSVDLPRHFYHFSPDTLKKVVQHVGLQVQRVETVANPRYLIQSIRLALMDRAGFGSQLGLSDDQWDAGRDAELFDALRPFCRILEARGQGSSIRLVATLCEPMALATGLGG